MVRPCDPLKRGPKAESGGRVLGKGQGAPVPISYGPGSAVSSLSGVRRSPGKYGFWSILEPQKSRQKGQLAFNLGATSESGGGAEEGGARAPAPT